MTDQAAGARSWGDLLADGRLSRFALICLGVWLNAADRSAPTSGMVAKERACSSWSQIAGIARRWISEGSREMENAASPTDSPPGTNGSARLGAGGST